MSNTESDTVGGGTKLATAPLRALSNEGRISPEEEAVGRRFYADVVASGLLSQLIPEAVQPDDDQAPDQSSTDDPKVRSRVRGVFAMLKSVDQRLLATAAALLLEIRASDDAKPVSVAEVGRRVMGYEEDGHNEAAGGALLRAALWIIRFGYQNPAVTNTMLSEQSGKDATSTEQLLLR